MIDDSSTLPVPTGAAADRVRLWTAAPLANIPEEQIRLAKQKSARARRAYQLDVQHFMRTLDVAITREKQRASPL
jgi:hypothetical protein